MYQGCKTAGELAILASAFESAGHDFASLDVNMQALYTKLKHRENGEKGLIAKLKSLSGGQQKSGELATLASAFERAGDDFASLDFDMQALYLNHSEDGEEELIAKLKRMSGGQQKSGDLNTLSSAFERAGHDFASLDVNMQALYNKLNHREKDGEEELIAKLKSLSGGHHTTGELATLASAFERADYEFASLDVDMQALYTKHMKDDEEELIAKLKRMSGGCKTGGELSTLAAAFKRAGDDFASLDFVMQALYNNHIEKDGEEKLIAKLKRMSGGAAKRRSDLTGDLLSSQNQKVIKAAGGKIVMIKCDLCTKAKETTTRVVGEVTFNNGVKESDNSKKKVFRCTNCCKEANPPRRKGAHANWTLIETISCEQDETGVWVALAPAASNDSTK